MKILACIIGSFFICSVCSAQIHTINRKAYTDYVNVKFEQNVFENANEIVQDLSKFKTQYSNFRNALSKFGNIKIIKLQPRSVVNDTIRYDKSGKLVRINDLSLFYRISFPKPVDLWETVHELRNSNLFENVDPPIYTFPCSTPNDYNLVGDQWYLNKINAQKAWDITKGKDNIIIAIIDKGINTNHTDLSNKIVFGGSTTFIGDHGTEVAGLAAASTDNNIGIASLGWNLKLKSYNYLDYFGGVAGAIEDAISTGVDIINCSFQNVTIDESDDTKFINYQDLYVTQNIENAIAQGIIVVAAAGNENLPVEIFGEIRSPKEPIPHPVYPAADAGVIGVSATDVNDAFLTNYNYGSHVDICAPGKQILTTSIFGQGFTYNDGTSLSCPLVSALAGLIKSIGPNLSNSQIVNIIQNSSFDLGATGYDNHYGYGRIDAYNALEYAIANYNTVLYDNVLFGHNVTVNSGASLSISPGAVVSFTNGASLIIDGTLTVSDATFDFSAKNSLTQNGIRINHNAQLNAYHLKVKNAWFGIHSYRGVQNVEAFDCQYGIYIYGTAAVGDIIAGNKLHNNSVGLAIYNVTAQTQEVIHNHIYSNTQHGIFCSNSSPEISQNNIYNNLLYGINVYNNSYPCIGNASLTCGTQNNIYNNLTYNLCNQVNGVLYALNNYWGNPVQTNKFFSSSGTIIYSPYLNSPVNIPLNKSMISYQEVPDLLLNKLLSVNYLIDQGKIQQAKEVCLEVIEQYPDSAVTFNFLNALKFIYKDDLTESITLFKSLFNKNSKKNIYGMAGLILANLDEKSRLNILDEVINYYVGEDIVELALYNKFLFYYNEAKDIEKAKEVMMELDILFSDSEGAKDAHLTLGGELNEEKYNRSNSSLREVGYKFETNNYPNPFNPSTKIKFSLPMDGLVIIKIYDLLGTEVVTLVDEYKTIGNHEVHWRGKDSRNNEVNSGIYFYTIEYNNKAIAKKIILLK